MSQVLIHQYLAELDRIKKVSGSQRETIVREAFKDLLKAWGKQQELVFLAEYPLKTAAKTGITVDGALLHELRMPLGYWEAKDARDDLDQEIARKFKKGYPQDNIVFSDDATVVLWQQRQEVMRCPVEDTARLEKLLHRFFGYERPEIENFRAAVEQFKADLPAVLDALRQMIASAEKTNAAFRAAQDRFLAHAREAINPALTGVDVREMLIQHILTEEIFDKVFGDSDFHHQNNVARELYALEGACFPGAIKKQTPKGLEPYYAAIRAAAALIGGHAEKQTFLKVIYENFYKVYNAKAADRLRVVYTPGEIVRFMIEGADWLCERHFGKNLIDQGVDILDPAAGTGTFVCELLEHFRGQPKKLAHKYQRELHANEVAILPYYVANLNIEATYAAITGSYDEFPNLCFVDTLDNVGLHTAVRGTNLEMFAGVSEENVQRIQRQNNRRISVIIGNPPYNANQQNENDNNKNREYPVIDQRIKQTYIHESTAQKTKLYDMYARFFRWASDRLHENGVLALVTNRSFIDSRTFDGFRKTVAREFNEIRIVDLGGDVRANPKLSGTRHNVFGIQAGVAISFFVKKPGKTREHRCRIHYARRPELETADEKLGFLTQSRLATLPSEEIRPDARGNWINQTHNDFETLLPLASQEAAKRPGVFKLHTLGISSNRDEWVYGETEQALLEKIGWLHARYKTNCGQRGAFDPAIKWSETLKRRLAAEYDEPLTPKAIRASSYRPFTARALYASSLFVDRPGRMAQIPNAEPTLCLSFGKDFRVLSTGCPFDLHFLGDTTGFPRRCLASDGSTIDNVTDWALKQFSAHYAGELGKGKDARKITKEAIFHYCYAVLHEPAYRREYAQNLKREFPRIPLHKDFWRWAEWGEKLMALHIGYESVEPFALARHDAPDAKARAAGLSPKALLKSDPASGSIALDTETTLRGVPPQAWAYRLGNRCAIDWVLDQYKEKKPKDPTIREKFNTYRFADHKEKIIDLLRRVTTVSAETMRLVGAMESRPR
jgi:predicted helicase